MKKSNFALRLQPSLMEEAHLNRAGVGQPPLAGDELPAERRAKKQAR